MRIAYFAALTNLTVFPQPADLLHCSIDELFGREAGDGQSSA